MISEPFGQFVDRFAPAQIPLPAPDNVLKRAGRKLAQASALGKLIPKLKRAPYDEFMLRLHDRMKEDAEFQRSCPKEHFSFQPGSSWMVYTETVPHAVLSGQFALEQTLLIDPRTCVLPQSAPLAILDKIIGAPVA